jgi:glucose/arabinose dehydrogenase
MLLNYLGKSRWAVGVRGKRAVDRPGAACTAVAAFLACGVFAARANAQTLYEADYLGPVNEISPGGSVTTFATGSFTGLEQLAFGPNGNLYVANGDEAAIDEITPGGSVSAFLTGLGDVPNGVAFGSGGDLFIAENYTSRIDEVTPGGSISLFAAVYEPGFLTFGRNGNLYVGTGDSVDEITPGGSVSTFASGFGEPAGLAFDSAGNLFVADFTEGNVDEVTPGGSVSTFATGFDQPYGLTFGPNGNLYVANFGSSTIDEVTPGGTVSTFASGLDEPTGLAFQPIAAPEPSSLVLALPIGLSLLAGVQLRRQRNRAR